MLISHRHGKPVLMAAAVEATTQLMSKGSSFEHQKLMDADIFSIAVQLHDGPLSRHQTFKLLSAIISHLGHVIVLDERLTRDLFSLFKYVINLGSVPILTIKALK